MSTEAMNRIVPHDPYEKDGHRSVAEVTGVFFSGRGRHRLDQLKLGIMYVEGFVRRKIGLSFPKRTPNFLSVVVQV